MGKKLIKAVRHAKMDEEDQADVLFWQSKSPSERLQEVVRLRKNYYTWLNGSFPEKMIRVITYRPKIWGIPIRFSNLVNSAY